MEIQDQSSTPQTAPATGSVFRGVPELTGYYWWSTDRCPPGHTSRKWMLSELYIDPCTLKPIMWIHGHGHEEPRPEMRFVGPLFVAEVEEWMGRKCRQYTEAEVRKQNKD